MSTATKPTIVIVQGSFQTPLFYGALLTGLLDAGYPVIHPRLPSCTNVDDADFPTRTLTDDSLAVTVAIQRLVEAEGKTVVVVMHSYGGLVGSNAIPEELSYSYRQSRGFAGGVIHLFYFCAFILGKGQSVLGVFGESPNNDVRPDGRFCIRNGAKILFNDLPDSEAALWESRLIPQSYKVQTTPLTRAAYEYIPSTYLITENDRAVPVRFQEMFAATIKAQVVRCSSGHSPMLSQPAVLVEKITAAVEGALRRAGPGFRR
ncbi:hypothetical protein VTN96DRAFT_1137 [Rasamsonia emersonii]